MVTVVVEADDVEVVSDGAREASSSVLVSEIKGGGRRERLADVVGNAACSQATCSGVNGGGVELMVTTATNRERDERCKQPRTNLETAANRKANARFLLKVPTELVLEHLLTTSTKWRSNLDHNACQFYCKQVPLRNQPFPCTNRMTMRLPRPHH